MAQISVGAVEHAAVMRAIELFGTRVAPIVREEVARREPAGASSGARAGSAAAGAGAAAGASSAAGAGSAAGRPPGRGRPPASSYAGDGRCSCAIPHRVDAPSRAPLWRAQDFAWRTVPEAETQPVIVRPSLGKCSR